MEIYLFLRYKRNTLVDVLIGIPCFVEGKLVCWWMTLSNQMFRRVVLVRVSVPLLVPLCISHLPLPWCSAACTVILQWICFFFFPYYIFSPKIKLFHLFSSSFICIFYWLKHNPLCWEWWCVPLPVKYAGSVMICSWEY